MATKVKVTDRSFFNEYRNGSSFSSNTSEYTTRLQGNIGENLKSTITVEVATIVNELKSTEITWDSTRSMFTTRFLNWADEGLWIGADLIIEWDGYSGNPESVTATVDGISNDGEYLIIDSTGKTNINAAGLGDGEKRSDIVIKVSTVYDFARFKFGVIPNERNSNDYNSPLDGTPQAYYLRNISGSLQSMTYSDVLIGSDISDSVKIKFDSTASSYIHSYTLEHIFRVPFYVERDKANMNDSVAPFRFKGDKSFKYCFAFEFGGDSDNTTIRYEDNGEIGSLGWFNENFNGFENFYSVSDFAVSNDSSTGVLEATETNTVTFSIASSSSIGFSGSEEIIIYHAKLAQTEDYSNRSTAFDTNFIMSQVSQTEGAAAAASGIFSSVTVTFNAVSTELDVSMEIDFSSDQQALITDADQYVLFFTIATQNLSTPRLVDRTNVIASVGTYSKDTNTTGLIGTPQPYVYQPSQAYSGTGYTDINGFDGDILGFKQTFTTDVSSGALIKELNLKLISYASDTDYFVIKTLQRFPIGRIRTCSDGTYTYQVITYNGTNDLKLPTDHNLKDVYLKATVPGSPSANQSWEVKTGFQIPFRSWVENLNIPSCFYNDTETNNGLNDETSNYDDGTYDIRLMLEATVSSTGNEDTIYRMLTNGGTVRARGTAIGAFTVALTYQDSDGNTRDGINAGERRIIIATISHTSGTLNTANLEGRIWIAVDNSSESSYYLSSVDDMTNPDSPLEPSDTLDTGNATLVEITSTNNEVVLKCATNPKNINKDKSYYIYTDLIPR